MKNEKEKLPPPQGRIHPGRRLQNLRYRMRKRGYQISDEYLVAIMPDEPFRSYLQEERLRKFGYSIQYKMF